MAQEYTITKVSDQPPKEWKHGISYYKVMVDGHSKPIDAGKKAKPNVGDKLYGDIQVQPQEQSDKFVRVERPDSNFSTPSSPAKAPYQPKDEAAIQAMWAIGQSVGFWSSVKTVNEAGALPLDGVESLAQDLFAMVLRVKAGDSNVNGSVLQKSVQISTEQQPASDLVPVENYDNVPTDLEDEVDLDSIPF